MAKHLKAGTHGTTYGGNPLACAAGNAVLDVILAPGFLDQVDRVARHLWRGFLDLAEAPSDGRSRACRARACCSACKLRPEVSNGEMQGAAAEEGLLTVAAGMNVLRVAPPLIITEAEADEAIRLLDRACLRMTPGAAKVAAPVSAALKAVDGGGKASPRHFLEIMDHDARDAAAHAGPGGAGEARRGRGQAAGGQDRGADLREALHPHARSASRSASASWAAMWWC